jgi:hypothetical protein
MKGIKRIRSLVLITSALGIVALGILLPVDFNSNAQVTQKAIGKSKEPEIIESPPRI